MKKFFSPRKTSIVFFFIPLLIMGCQDEPTLRTSYSNPVENNDLSLRSEEGKVPHAGIGELIPLDEAVTLTKNYQTAHPDQPAAYFIGTASLQQLLDLPGLVALRWIFGYTAEAKLTIIVEPLLETASGIVVADDEQLLQVNHPEGYEPSPFYHGEAAVAPELLPTDGMPITLSAAQRLIDAYRLAHPMSILSFIQGQTVIEELLTSHATPGLWVYLGQGELGVPEVLLTPSNIGNSTPAYPVADRSTICPPDCLFTSQLF